MNLVKCNGCHISCGLYFEELTSKVDLNRLAPTRTILKRKVWCLRCAPKGINRYNTKKGVDGK